MIQLNMSIEELLALPVSVDLVTAGRAFGLGRTKSFELAQAGLFPCTVLRVGVKYRVPRNALFAALCIDPALLSASPEPVGTGAQPATSSVPGRRTPHPRGAGREPAGDAA